MLHMPHKSLERGYMVIQLNEDKALVGYAPISFEKNNQSHCRMIHVELLQPEGGHYCNFFLICERSNCLTGKPFQENIYIGTYTWFSDVQLSGCVPTMKKYV